MGHIASALRVTPGTATSMVKALAEAGLVHYEPYSGARLTSGGEKLAALVLRRHRLVEQFLVQVMRLPWDEVHADAELLEHVVSERLIDRMDEMLGHPQVDPHGDPIPDQNGSVRYRELPNLLTCPLGTPVTVTRVVDQDAAFLRFIEQRHLKPGQVVEVEERDQMADSVRVRSRDGDRLTIGARAASKLLVELAVAFIAFAALGGTARGQSSSSRVPSPPAAQSSVQTSATPSSSAPFEIMDNSFLVEEAFNQEAGIFQNIFTFLRDEHGAWATAFTQEWPAPGVRHQLSVTVPFSGAGSRGGVGDVALNYRLQVLNERRGVPAFSPRISALFPSGNSSEGRGTGSMGWQVNLPFSKQIDNVYVHWNAGVTWYPSVSTSVGPSAQPLLPAADVALTSPFLAGSAIVRVRPMLNLMLEAVAAWDQEVVAPSLAARSRTTILSPGLRGGWNIGDKQVIVGCAVPVSRSEGHTTVAVLGYFSYELPFRKRSPMTAGSSEGASTTNSVPVRLPSGMLRYPKP
jgi:DtxR family Mn-dependent transcriptional regulator